MVCLLLEAFCLICQHAPPPSCCCFLAAAAVRLLSCWDVPDKRMARPAWFLWAVEGGTLRRGAMRRCLGKHHRQAVGIVTYMPRATPPHPPARPPPAPHHPPRATAQARSAQSETPTALSPRTRPEGRQRPKWPAGVLHAIQIIQQQRRPEGSAAQIQKRPPSSASPGLGCCARKRQSRQQHRSSPQQSSQS